MNYFMNGGGGDKLVNQAVDPNKLFNNKACLDAIDQDGLARNSARSSDRLSGMLTDS